MENHSYTGPVAENRQAKEERWAKFLSCQSLTNCTTTHNYHFTNGPALPLNHRVLQRCQTDLNFRYHHYFFGVSACTLLMPSHISIWPASRNYTPQMQKYQSLSMDFLESFNFFNTIIQVGIYQFRCQNGFNVQK